MRELYDSLMAALKLNLTSDVHSQLQARAAESGFSNVEEYAGAVLRADAEKQLVDEDLEELLLKRLTDSAGSIV